MDNIQQFFDPIRKMSPERKELSDLPYEDIYPLIEMCDLLSKANNISTYIIDYVKENFLYGSSHPLFLSGYTTEKLYSMLEKYFSKKL